MRIKELQIKLSALRDLILYKEVVEQSDSSNLPQYRKYKKLWKELECLNTTINLSQTQKKQ